MIARVEKEWSVQVITVDREMEWARRPTEIKAGGAESAGDEPLACMRDWARLDEDEAACSL